MSYFNHYIVLGGQADGELFPRTAAGLMNAMASPGAEHICPARRLSSEHEAEDLRDWDDYGCEIDRSNASVFAKP